MRAAKILEALVRIDEYDACAVRERVKIDRAPLELIEMPRRRTAERIGDVDAGHEAAQLGRS